MKRFGVSVAGLVLLTAQLIVLLSVPQKAAAYTIHSPIYISGNGGFNASNGVTNGSGTYLDPFIIEGWEIDASSGRGIEIVGTTAYFIIRNVYVHSLPYSFSGAINLRNADNARVENSLFIDNHAAFYIQSCHVVDIVGNTIVTSGAVGIFTQWSSFVTVQGNVINWTTGYAIASYSTAVVIQSNEIYANGMGIFLGENASVTGNHIAHNLYGGIQISGASVFGTITNNLIEYNGLGNGYRGGIFVENNSAGWAITHNQIRNNNNSGIEVSWQNSHNYTIEDNELSYNSVYGAHLQSGADFTITHNNFIGNYAAQANDSGTRIIWDIGCPSGGNYWSDYTGTDNIECLTGSSGTDGLGDSPYVIDFDSKDNYPFMLPLNLSMNNTPPTVIVTSPNGGESWQGGTAQDVTWWMSDDVDQFLLVWLMYSTDGGSTWAGIPSADAMVLQNGNESYSWTLPLVNTSSALVKVIVEDFGGLSGSDQSDSVFAIYLTGPYIVSTYPGDGQWDVPVDTWIVVTFNKSMNTTSVSVNIIPAIILSENWSMNDMIVTYMHTTPFVSCVNYTVQITGEDYSGFPLVPGPVPNPWTFSTCTFNPPSVSLLNPVGGEDWTGGYVKTLSWNVSDPDDVLSNLTVDIYYSVDGGSTWSNIVAGLPGTTTTYDWLVPFVNTTAAKVKVCATDPMNNTGCGTSGLFTIDSASPTVVSTIPPDGATDVPLNQTVTVYWGEAMNSATGLFDFAPPVTGNSNWNPGRTTVEFTPSALLSICTDYSVNLTGFKDDSDPGNAMAATYTFAFKTICPGPPHVTLLRPVGGEYWRGGSSQLINWTAFDDLTSFKNITFFVNYSSSASSGTLVGPVRMLTAYLWNVPSIDAVDVKINVTAIDLDRMAGYAESGQFTIDSTPPSMSSRAPTGWNVPVNSAVTVTFTEPVIAAMNRTSLAIALRDGGTGQWVPASRAPSGFTASIQLIPTQPLSQCAAYDASVNDTFIDRASWALTNPTTWTFHTVCPPTVSFQTAMVGKDWSGGSSHVISWTMGDEIDAQLRVWVNYSKDNGTDGYPYIIYTGMMTTGTKVYTLTVPLIDSSSARFRVQVADSSGIIVSSTSASFTIDSSPPAVLSSVPANSSFGVKMTDDVQIVFTEAIVRTSANQSFSMSPDPGGLSVSWQRTVSGKDIMVIAHKQLSQKTDYTITLSTALSDVSDPGNRPAKSLTIRFSTKPPPNVVTPVAKAVGKNQIAVDERTTFDGSQSTGPITKWVWTITDNQGNIVDVLDGTIVTFTFTKNGRYRVTLRVIDETWGDSDEDYIEINVTSSVNAGTIILLSSAFIAAVAIGGTEVGRTALFMLLAVPVYKRKMKGKEDAETRGMVKGYVLVHPGDTYTDIRNNLKLHNGSATWHLMKLEKEGVIKSQIDGTHKRFYPAKMPPPVGNGGSLHEIQRKMLGAVKTEPGMTVNVLAEHLGVSSQLALYHLRKLSEKGMIQLERKGLRLKVFPSTQKNT